jgi:hypothetical protein
MADPATGFVLFAVLSGTMTIVGENAVGVRAVILGNIPAITQKQRLA